jgi:hypothetical protein
MQDAKLKQQAEPYLHVFSFLFAGVMAFGVIGLHYTREYNILLRCIYHVALTNIQTLNL